MKSFTKEFTTICEMLAHIYFNAKVLHWNFTKDYSLHLLFDRISEDCIDAIDSVAESCILPFEGKVEELDFQITSKESTLENLKTTIQDLADMIQKLAKDEEMSEGAKNTLSGIAEMLNVKAYLISNSTNGNNQ